MNAIILQQLWIYGLSRRSGFVPDDRGWKPIFGVGRLGGRQDNSEYIFI
jgi:hypothetical protein